MRRVQRLPPRSRTKTCYFGLGRLNIECYIHVRKLFLIGTSLNMDEDEPVEMVFRYKLENFIINRHMQNNFITSISPTYKLLRVAECFGLVFVNHNNDILESVCGDSKYISWLSLSDKRPLIRVCETLVKIVSKVSRLNSDDVYHLYIECVTIVS